MACLKGQSLEGHNIVQTWLDGWVGGWMVQFFCLFSRLIDSGVTRYLLSKETRYLVSSSPPLHFKYSVYVHIHKFISNQDFSECQNYISTFDMTARSLQGSSSLTCQRGLLTSVTLTYSCDFFLEICISIKLMSFLLPLLPCLQSIIRH